MSEEVQVNTKLTEQGFNSIVAPFQLDLLAYYNELMKDVTQLVGQAEKEGWTNEELISKIDDMFSD
jgi:hypothetical protein